MTTITEAELIARRLPIAGTYNVRDVGGYVTSDGRSVKWKTVLRGDALHKVDDVGRSLFAEYGLRTSIDLREQDERQASPDQLHEDVQLVSVPLFSYAAPGALLDSESQVDRSQVGSLADVYALLIRERGTVLVAAIREILRPGALPVIVHCTAGKDRTGVVVALVLGVLGVPDEVIAADFSATGLFLDDEFANSMVAQTEAAGLDVDRLRAMLSADPELIMSVLDYIRANHGDVESYLIDHGMSANEPEMLRALLLDGDHEMTDSEGDTGNV